ncbi:hypothetical protein O9929_03340 [Vibrio lentus]|nr:hypothetical protein [Vibrio lentus]
MCGVTAETHLSPVEETMATLYPRYSDDAAQQNAAAFRYLDNMFTLDPGAWRYCVYDES